MAFQGVLAMLLVMMIILAIIVGIINISGILGIVFGCVSADKSKKYVSLRGNLDFKQVKSSHTLSKVFFIINCIILGLTVAIVILLSVELTNLENSDEYHGDDYYEEYNDYEELTAADLIMSVLTSSAVPIASIVVGVIAINKFKDANELKEELDSKGLKSYPLPQNPYFNAQRYQNPYYNQYYNGQYPNNPYNGYQGQNYYGQYPNNGYQNQYPYRNNGQYPNNGYQNTYQNPYQNNQNNGQYANQGYVDPPQSGGQAGDGAQANFIADGAKIKCPSCGTENEGKNMFCVNCGNTLK